jgi:nitrous oxidase accessory protein
MAPGAAQRHRDMILALLLAAAQPLTVGPGGYASISRALAAAAPGDTIRVRPGVYREHPVIRRPVVLLGDSGAVLDGGGEGTVLTLRARAIVRGVTIRRSGRDQSTEDSGILVANANGTILEGNTLEDVLFGIYLKQCDSAVVRGNTVVGADLPAPRRGDGIRLWYSHDGRIEHNRVDRSRDVVIWFSNRTIARGNVVRDSRYGLHYMYSDSNAFEDNTFIRNHVGAFIMYSRHLTFRGNTFADSRGTTGRGLGFKDAEDIVAERNVLRGNSIGLSFDNSPASESGRNRIVDNVIAGNDVGVMLLPSVRRNVFRGNEFVGNATPVTVTGSGTATGNRWVGNYWSDYAGFDEDGDGHGDMPFRHARLADDLFQQHPALRFFRYSPSESMLDAVSRVLPFLEPVPVVIDSQPLVARSLLLFGQPARGTSRGAVALGVSLALAGLAVVPFLRRKARFAR